MSAIDEKKEFVIKHVFTDVMNIEPDEMCYGNKKNHFNVSWQISLVRDKGFGFLEDSFVIDLNISKCRGTGAVETIETETEMNLISTTGERFCQKREYRSGYNDNCFEFSPEQMKKYLVDGNLTVEMHVRITKLEGIKGNLRSFDESTKGFSDIVLKVKDEKFYVLKTYLAAHSSYFQSLFFGNFDESEKSEIELKDIDPYDFQNFLEVIYGEPAFDEDTIDGILHLADMYDSKTAMRRCEEYLTYRSEQPLKEKFEIAIKYKMNELRKKLLSEIKTKEHVISLAPTDPNQMEPALWAELFHKIASFK